MSQDESLQAGLGYTFREPALLTQALTHRSFMNECQEEGEQHNERLEFIGDAVVDLSVADQLMQRLPAAREGELSKLRAMVVSEVSLARAAQKIELGGFLRLGRGELQSGGQEKPSILSDALEAVIGAVYLDGGFEAAHGLACRLLRPLLEQAVDGVLDRDHKTRFQELSQREWHCMPTYEIVQERGPDHAKVFEVSVAIGEREVARAEGPSKKLAEQRAARLALSLLAEE